MTTSPGIPIGTGSPITVPVTGAATQVPLTAQGGTIVNIGATPVNLSPTDPVQGSPYVLAPNGSVPWPGVGTLYATVTGSTPGLLYYVNGVTAFASGNSGIGATALSGEASVLCTPGIFIPSGFAQPLNNVGAFNVWNYTYASTGVDATKGNVTWEFVTANGLPGALAPTDVVKAPNEASSNRLAGLYVPGSTVALGYNVIITNNTDVEIEATLTYSPVPVPA